MSKDTEKFGILVSKDTEKFGILVSKDTEMWARATHLGSSSFGLKSKYRFGLGLLGRLFLNFTIRFYCDPVLIEAHMLDGTRSVEHFQSEAASIFSLPAEFNGAAA